MAVPQEQLDAFLDLLDEVEALPEQEAERLVDEWLGTQENGQEILDEYLGAMTARPATVQKLMDFAGISEEDAIAQLYPTPNNGFPQNPTNPS
jgi:uncharacterized protein YidB (DUF937 family)